VKYTFILVNPFLQNIRKKHRGLLIFCSARLCYFGASNNASTACYVTLLGNNFIFSYKYAFQNCLPPVDFAEQQIHRDHNRMQQAMRGGTSGVPVEDLCISGPRVDINGDWTASRLQATDTKPPFFRESHSHV